jgi:hypothetical protein
MILENQAAHHIASVTVLDHILINMLAQALQQGYKK